MKSPQPRPLARMAVRWCPAAAAAVLAVVCLGGAELAVKLNNGHLQVAAPSLRLIAGKPLERLKNGASVAFDFQLSVWNETRLSVLGRALERFVVSYDLWEERFSVTKPRGEKRSESNLAAGAVESWCLDQLGVAVDHLPRDRNLWVTLEVRAGDSRAQAPVVGEPGINLTSLVEIFSRPSRGQQSRWFLEAGPLRLNDLGKSPGTR